MGCYNKHIYGFCWDNQTEDFYLNNKNAVIEFSNLDIQPIDEHTFNLKEV